MTVNKIDPKVIFASNAPTQDKPAQFENYTRGMDETRKRDGRPTIKQFNFLQEQTDKKILWIHENGGALPYDSTIDYQDGAIVLKDGELQQKNGDNWDNVVSDDTTLKNFESGKSYPVGALILLDDGVTIVQNTLENNTNNPNSNMIGWVKPNKTAKDVVTTVDSVADLADLEFWDGRVVYAQDINKNYIYRSDSSLVENGVTVVGKWEMEIQDSYYSSWFADSSSSSSQTLALQAGYDYAVSKDRPFIIDEAYNVAIDYAGVVLYIRSNSDLRFKFGIGKFNLINTNAIGYAILYIYRVSNYKIYNPELVGDRLVNTQTAGEWGHGIQILDSSNGFIFKPNVSQCCGDGIDIGRKMILDSYDPTDTIIMYPTVIGARRNGISARSFVNLTIVDPTVSRVGDYDGVVGAYPKAGIDVEPNDAVSGGELPKCLNLKISNPYIFDCYAGLYLYNFQARRYEVEITGVTTLHNCTNTCLGAFNSKDGTTGYVQIQDIVISGSVFTGLSVGWVESSCKVNINKITPAGGVVSLPIRHVYNGTTSGQVIGGFTANFKLHSSCNAYLIMEAVDVNYTLNSSFNTTKDSERGLGYIASGLTTLEQLAKQGSNFKIQGDTYLTNTSPRISLRSTDTIYYQETTDTAVRTLLTTKDYSRKKVVFAPNSLKNDYGVAVSGLSIQKSDGIKNTATTKTLGATLDYKNVEGGSTIIYSMSGEWVLS